MNHQLDNQSVEQVLINNADNHTAEKVKTLEQLSATVDDKRMNIQNEFNTTPESTIVRTAEEVADNIGISDEAIKKRNIKLTDYKNENN